MQKALSPNRKEWLDALRGFAMLMVVLIHNLPTGIAKSIAILITNPVKVPLFFIISGYVFNGREGRQGAFFLNLLRKILIPSFVFIACLKAVGIPAQGLGSFIDGMADFISGESFWYISACVLGEILFFYNLKFCKKDWQIALTALVCWAAGFAMSALGIGNFAMLNRAFIAQFFLLIGYLFRRYETFFKKLHWGILVCGFLISLGMIVAAFFLWKNKGIDVHSNYYYGTLTAIPFSFLLITVYALSLLTLGTKRGRLSKPLAIVGRHTLIIYILHGHALTVINRLLCVDNSSGVISLLKSVLATALAITVCCIGSWLVNWFLPELMGRKRKKKVQCE